MSSLSIVLATYNEEKNIGDCLQSIKNIADEIIVVDGSSTDNTVGIAKQFDAKIKVTNNPPIFHINKQKAIDAATKDWILQLDADERVSKNLADEIKTIIRQNADINGYWIPRKNFFLGRFLMKGGQYPDYTMRLYRRGKGRLPQKDVHEQAVVEGRVGYLKEPLLHIADADFSRYLLRFDRYTTLLAKEIQEGNHGNILLVTVQYLFLKPTIWFVWTYLRHKGFMDGWPGFVFSLFSSLRFPVAYVKYIRGV